MKIKKILFALVLMLIFASILSLNVFAEVVDYNSVVGVKDNGNNVFFSLEGSAANSKWQDYISYYNSLHPDSPFGVINNLVTYKGYFLRNRTGILVYATDNLIVASGCIYTLESIFVVENNTLKFNELIGNKITFADLLENIKQTLFTVDYSAQRSTLYYDSMPVLMNGGHVDTSLFIHTDIIYTLGAVCSHEWRIERNIELPTCIKTGSAEVNCILCNTIKIIDVPIDTEYGHLWQSISYAGPTCVKSGIEILTCQYCSKTSQEVLKPLGHKYTSPTCTEDGQCIRCGVIVEIALGHNLKHGSWGKCLRNGCDYRLIDVQGALNSAGTYFNNWWKGDVEEPTNNVIEQVKQDVEDAIEIVNDTLSNIGDGAKNLVENIVQSGNNIKQFFSRLFSVSAFITIVLFLIIGLNYVLSFYNSINTFKDIRRRKKRRKKNKNKKKIENKEITIK